jgi:hypothetical protein
VLGRFGNVLGTRVGDTTPESRIGAKTQKRKANKRVGGTTPESRIAEDSEQNARLFGSLVEETHHEINNQDSA